MKQYYICKPGGTQEGPYPEEMVQACLIEGIYPEGTSVWCEGMEGWQSISILAPQSAADNSAVSTAPGTGEISPAQPEEPTQPSPRRALSTKAIFNKKITVGLCAVCLLGGSLSLPLCTTEPEEKEVSAPAADIGDIDTTAPHTDMPQESTGEESPQQAAVNATDEKGLSALHHAAHQGNPYEVRRLIQAGAKVNAISGNSEIITQDTNKNTTSLPHQLLYANRTSPLIWAALGGAADCMELLIKAGADINFQDEMGNTALHAAAACGFADCVQVLIQAGADVNKQTQNGLTPLHFSMTYDAADCMKLLIKAGADINGTASGELPLYLARVNNAVGCTQVLLQAGADPEIKDGRGSTAYEYHLFDLYCPACLPMKRRESTILILKALAAKRISRNTPAGTDKDSKETSEDIKKSLAAAISDSPADLQALFSAHKGSMGRRVGKKRSAGKVVQLYVKAVRLLQEEVGNQIPDWEVVDLTVSHVTADL